MASARVADIFLTMAYVAVFTTAAAASVDTTTAAPKCVPPFAPAHGNVLCFEKTNELFCTATCNDGYIFPSHAPVEKRVCVRNDATWIDGGTFPDCIGKDTLNHDLCHAPHPPENGIVRCELVNNKLECKGTCNDGFVFESHEALITRVCDITDGTWYYGNAFPKCTESLRENCTLPKAPENGKLKCDLLGESLICTAVCNNGYSFDTPLENGQRICDLTTGVWVNGTQDYQTCQNISIESQCEELPHSKHVQVHCQDTGTELVCQYTCENGFGFESHEFSVQRVCNQLIGQWLSNATIPTCLSKCDQPIDIAHFSASSDYKGLLGVNFGPERSMLNSTPEYNKNLVFQAGGWRAGVDDLNQFIQVTLTDISTIRGIITLGRAVLANDSADEYLTRFRILYSTDGKDFAAYSDKVVSDKFLDGNTASDIPKVNMLEFPITAKYVQLNPLDWHQHISLRFALLGCPAGEEYLRPMAPSSTVSSTVPSVQSCEPLLPPENGLVNCETSREGLVCTAVCKDGYTFSDTQEPFIMFTCHYNTSFWVNGSRIPTCIYMPTIPSVTHQTPLHVHTASPSPLPADCVQKQADCRIGNNGDFQACGQCHYFATCSEGILYVRPCPNHLEFDANEGRCNFASTTCKNRHSPQSETHFNSIG